jgi:Ca-activated chloride channel homolog
MTTLPPLTLDELTHLDRRRDDAERGFGAMTSPHGHLPLGAMSVRADLAGLVSSVSVRQTFRNCHSVTIEATYIFPLPDRSAVTDFAVTLGGRRIVGTLQERQAARDNYDAAMEAGRRAAIVEEERPDIFTTRVGNLAPGEQAVVELTLAGRLPYQDGEATFRFPLVVAPRYVPGCVLPGQSVGDGVAMDTDTVPDASRIGPPVLLPGVANPVRLSLSATLQSAGLIISELRSSLHAVTTSGALPGPVTVEIEAGERLDRDFILRYRVADNHDATGVSATAIPDAEGDEGTYLVTVLPPPSGSATTAERDVVVVLDRSGSMEGWKIVAARRAAARIVDSLTSDDRFAVVAFDHEVDRPTAVAQGPWLVSATDRNRYLAVEWLARIEARGGTELLPALTEALAAFDPQDGDGRRARTCVIVTDGQVGNDDQLVRAAANSGVRLFTVGIDRAVNAGLLRRLAASSGGRCDLVESEDRLDEVLTSLHRRIGDPVLEAVTVRLPGMSLLAGTATPAGAADVHRGAPLVIAGRYRGEPDGRVVVTGFNGAGSQTLESTVNVMTNAAAAAVWARAHVRDLEDGYAAAGPEADLDRLAATIVAVSLRHRVLCRFTAFVAVDDTGRQVNGAPHAIVQPVELPSGWSADALGGPGPMRASRMTALTAPSQPAAAPGPTGAPIPRPAVAAESAPDALPPNSAPAGGVGSNGPRIRLPGRHSGGGRFRPYDEPAVPDPYQNRLDGLLAAVDELLAATDGVSAPAAPAQPAVADVRTLAGDVRTLAGDLRTLAGDLRTLAGDLRTLVDHDLLGTRTGADPLADPLADALALALEGLAAALDGRRWKEMAARTEGVRRLLKERPLRQGWWR